MPSRLALLAIVLLPLTCNPASAQSVVSVRSGVIHFFEGSVSIDGQPLEQKFGRFYDVKQGSELRTDDGRAEVLLTPGVFLRIDQNSSMRMVSTRLSDTRVEFIGGSALLDSRNGATNPSLTIVYKSYQVQIRKQGRYRFNSAPAELRVEDGEAEVSANSKSTLVAPGHMMAFTAALASRSFDADNVEDGLDRWAQSRSDSIQAGDASAAVSDNLTSALDNPAAGGVGDFSAYPYDPGLSPYNGVAAAPPFSIYGSPMFGYPYVPLYRMGLAGAYPYRGFRTPNYTPPAMWRPPARIGTYTRPPIGSGPRPAIAHPIGGSVGRHR